MSHPPITTLGRRWIKGLVMRRDLRPLSTEFLGKSAENTCIESSAEVVETLKEPVTLPVTLPASEETTTEPIEEQQAIKLPKITNYFVSERTRLSRNPLGIQTSESIKRTRLSRNPLAIQTSASIERQKYIAESFSHKYPRLRTVDSNIESDIVEINKKYAYLEPNTILTDKTATIRGRVTSLRSSSSKLYFIDVTHDGAKIQVILNFSIIRGEEEHFVRHASYLRVGDIVSVTGHIGRSQRGQLSIFATSLFEMLAPCIHTIPTAIENLNKRFHYRHVDLLVNSKACQILRLRSDIIQYIRNFLLNKGFLEVQTPVLADSAGGAAARPFLTTSSIFKDKKLALRIAPELWLKRLVIGGMEKVFEIGTQFRNENADATHNPEFTTLEFYQAYIGLDDLIVMTESLLSGLATHVKKLKAESYKSLPPNEVNFSQPFRHMVFIPSLERAIGRSLPNLEHPEEAAFQIRILYSDLGLELPLRPTLPRLLDHLFTEYLQPQCQSPTFITHHPECLSPLAKSTVKGGHNVSERLELFVQGQEIVNAYEEENSPREQRRKFALQRIWKNEDNSALVGHPNDATTELLADEAYVGATTELLADEAYIDATTELLADEAYVAALEWGLPPTGGFGMGIDRLCMLFSGTPRISEVLTFGGIKGVVGHGGVAGLAAAITPKGHQTGQREKERADELNTVEEKPLRTMYTSVPEAEIKPVSGENATTALEKGIVIHANGIAIPPDAESGNMFQTGANKISDLEARSEDGHETKAVMTATPTVLVERFLQLDLDSQDEIGPPQSSHMKLVDEMESTVVSASKMQHASKTILEEKQQPIPEDVTSTEGTGKSEYVLVTDPDEEKQLSIPERVTSSQDTGNTGSVSKANQDEEKEEPIEGDTELKLVSVQPDAESDVGLAKDMSSNRTGRPKIDTTRAEESETGS